MNDSTKFFYSYTNFIEERNNFKIVDKTGLNRYDSPTALYYKLIFYFTEDSGLLGLNDVHIDDNIDDIKEKIIVSKLKKPFDYDNVEDSVRKDTDNTDSVRYKNVTTALKNTSYNYLLLNAEYERAYMLKSFITLLSEINSSSPWYFQEITGLDTALERKLFSDGEFKLEDKPRQITIKCLHDAYDDRIGTLLDLYRAACFSYTEKKEIVPANLRKFNMGILVFNAPIRGKGGKSGIKENMILIPDKNTDSNYYIPSAKLIELRNCEIDYNSSKSAWGTLNTTSDPFSPEYTITINFDDCYESRYNEIMGSVVTDFINADINLSPNVKTINDNSAALGNDKTILGKKEVEKKYWTNSDYETAAKNIYSEKLDYNSNTSNINIGLNVGAAEDANILTTQWNNLKDKGKELIQTPSIKNNPIDDNIHYNGTVNMFGEYEYLNRLNGMDGALGSAVSQIAGGATNFARKEAAKLYLGNIRSWSVSNALEMSKRFLSGDIAGGIQDIDRLSSKEGELVRPIGGNRNIGEGLPDGGFVTSELWSDQAQRNLSFNPITKEIHDGGAVGRALNKGKVLDVDILNHTIGTENEISETHFTTENIQDNTSKTPTPRKMTKRLNDPNGNHIEDKFVTSELWTDPTQRNLGFNPITKEIHEGGVINRELNKGTVLDVDVINHTLGTENEQSETLFTTNEIWSDPTQRTINPSNGELWSDAKQRDLGFNPITAELWTDPFQRNIDSDMASELPGYIKNRTKFLNEMNTKQSIRNNI